MSTRSAITVPVADGQVALGRYHHFDGYPRGLGMQLVLSYLDDFGESLGRMIRTLIFDHPAGWSTIIGADWSYEPGFVGGAWADPDRECAECGEPQWRHYRQYYADRGEDLPPARVWAEDNRVLVLGHGAQPVEEASDNAPQCYCHGARSEGPQTIACVTRGMRACDGRDCDPLFIEWLYRLYPQGLEIWEGTEIEGAYRHVYRDRVRWDRVGLAAAMNDIELAANDRMPQWGAQMESLAQSLAELTNKEDT